MSYIITSIDKGTHIQASIIEAGTPTSATAGGRFSLSGSINGSASIVSDRLVLTSGSSYYLEGSILVRNANRDGYIIWQWYNSTTSTYVGSEGFMNFATSIGANARISRRVASAFILDSDISTSASYELRIKTLTGTGWDMTITSAGIDSQDYVGYPTARILELAT